MIPSGRMIGRAALVLGLLSVTACSTWPRTGVEALAGCWYFVQDEAALESGLPWGVRLVDAPLEGWPAMAQLDGVQSATTLAPGRDQDHPFAYWRLFPPGDSVHIGYPAGGGLVVEARAVLQPEGGPRLEGVVREVGDVIPPGSEGPSRDVHAVTLTRARCPEAVRR